jgi:hypothetical protein
MKHPITVGCDIDGVLYPFDAAARLWLHLNGCPDVPQGDVAERWDHLHDQVDKEWLDLLWSKGRQEVMDMCAPYAGAIKCLHRLEQHANLMLITHRPPDVAHATMRWCARHKLNPAVLAHGKSDKSFWAKDCILFIEDRPDNVIEILEHTKHTFVVTPRRGWNKGLWGRVAPDYARRFAYFNDWEEIPIYLKKHLAVVPGIDRLDRNLSVRL